MPFRIIENSTVPRGTVKFWPMYDEIVLDGKVVESKVVHHVYVNPKDAPAIRQIGNRPVTRYGASYRMFIDSAATLHIEAT